MNTRNRQLARRIVEEIGADVVITAGQVDGLVAMLDKLDTPISDAAVLEGAPRRFVLRRFDDETGMSGTGDVAEGIVFSDGTAAMRWRTEVASTALYPNLTAVETIHGHGGRTRVVLVDE